MEPGNSKIMFFEIIVCINKFLKALDCYIHTISKLKVFYFSIIALRANYLCYRIYDSTNCKSKCKFVYRLCRLLLQTSSSIGRIAHPSNIFEKY